MNKDPQQVIAAACDVFDISRSALLGRGSSRMQSRPRWAVALVLKEDGYGAAEIARQLHRDHTTILYGFKRAEEALKEEPVFARKVTELFARLDDSHGPNVAAQVRILTSRLEGARKGNKTLLKENAALKAENKRLAGQVSALTKNRDHWKAVAQEQKPSTAPEPKEPKKTIMRLPDWMTGECKAPDAALAKVWPKNVKVGAR